MQEGLWGRRAGVMLRSAYGHLGATAWSRKPRLPDEETASRKQRQLYLGQGQLRVTGPRGQREQSLCNG